MSLENLSLVKLHKTHIKGTEEKSIVADIYILLCNLTKVVVRDLNLNTEKIYVTTRMLKHLYDKRPAEEYDFIIYNLNEMVRFPDLIYVNKSGKRGAYLFTKQMNEVMYAVSIENKEGVEENYVVTAFRLRKENYLNGYELVWSWKGDTPSS